MSHIYEYGGNQKIYYTNEPVELGMLERQWLDSLKDEIQATSSFEHNVLVNLTWFKANWEETAPLRELVSSLGPKEKIKIWYAGSIDGNHWITNTYIEFYHHFVNEGYSYSFVGYSDEHWHTWYPKWFIKSTSNIQIDKLLLVKEPKYLYLAYNRKPKLHRERLVESLIKEKMHSRGWITYEEGKYPEIDSMSANTDQEKHSSDRRFSRPEDLTSVGNLGVWRNSYLVIASETDEADPWQISEKTWKPIFGMRPFLINGNNELYSILDKLGFFTPIDLFKNKNLDCSYTSVVDKIKTLYNLSASELYSLWEDQYEMLLHNRKRMFELAESDPTKILNWPQSKLKP